LPKTFTYLNSIKKYQIFPVVLMLSSILFISGCADQKSPTKSTVLKPTTEPTATNQTKRIESKDLYPIRVEKKGKVLWGYIDDTGKVIIKPRWDGVESFKANGIAKVYNYNSATGSNNNGIVDYKGNEIIPIKKGSWDFPVMGPEYIVTSGSEDEVSTISIVYDMRGKKLFQTDKSIERYSNGYFIFNDTGLWGQMDKTGKIIKSGLKYISTPIKKNNNKDKLIIFERADKLKYGLKDSKENVIVPAKYDNISENDNGESFYCQETYGSNGKHELLDKDGKLIQIKNYRDILYYGDGLFLICFDNDFYHSMSITFKYKIFDIRTGSISNPLFVLGGNLIDGNSGKINAISVYDGNKSFFVGRDGKQIAGSKAFEGKWIISNEGSLIKVASQSHSSYDDFFTYYNKEGKEIWKTNYEFDIGNGRTLKRAYYAPNICYSASYIELKDTANSSAEAKFNSHIKKIIQDKNLTEYKELYGFNVKIGIESQFLISKDLLTVIHSKSSYSGGGMGNVDNYYYHFNLKTGEQFEYLSFLKKGDSYKIKLQKIVKERFESKYKQSGFLPIDANSQNYYFTPDGIVFILDGYKFHGNIFVKFNEIESLLDKNAEIFMVCDLSKYAPYDEKTF